LKRLRPITITVAGLIALAAFAVPVLATSAAPSKELAGKVSPSLNRDDPLCQSHASLCVDTFDNTYDEYVGHDEPSIEYKSSVRGSGNDMTYSLTLPRDPANFPSANGAGGVTWNFQLRPTFWFGLTLCDTQSAPEFTRKCTPDSDANNLVGTDPTRRDYIGKHPGNAYMELQFYGPGYVPQFTGFGCSATQYCAAMTIDSRTLDQNTGVFNNADCNNYILGGQEPINWAYVTKSGVSQAPANPLFTGTFSNPNFAAVNPDYSKDLMMNPGDQITIHMFDTSVGFRAILTDVTTGQSGSMTASIGNGFAHILFRPGAKTCKAEPYAFHPEYDTANPRGNTWSAHTYNVAFSDEIGHFENCVTVDPATFSCKKPGVQDQSGLDEDDDNSFCVPGSFSSLVHINGCFSSDGDWDGQSYQNVWPGTNANTSLDQLNHPSPILFTSPLTHNGTVNYETIAFETDLPRIEAADSQDNPPFCDTHAGTNCFNPPLGAAFYPFFSTTLANSTCTWQEGGNYIPGTVNNFGGSSTTEFGPLLATVFPLAGFTPGIRYDNFNSGDMPNPCPVG
jgi:hypothetical protein